MSIRLSRNSVLVCTPLLKPSIGSGRGDSGSLYTNSTVRFGAYVIFHGTCWVHHSDAWSPSARLYVTFAALPLRSSILLTAQPIVTRVVLSRTSVGALLVPALLSRYACQRASDVAPYVEIVPSFAHTLNESGM